MKNTHVIKIIDIIASTISSRDIVAKLSKMIKKAPYKTVVLDFSNVDFVSRSATHELLRMKERFNSSWRLFNRKKIILENTNQSFKQMVQAISSAKRTPKEKVEFKAKEVVPDVLFKKNII